MHGTHTHTHTHAILRLFFQVHLVEPVLSQRRDLLEHVTLTYTRYTKNKSIKSLTHCSMNLKFHVEGAFGPSAVTDSWNK